MEKKRRVTRRDFLRLSAMTATGAFLAACAPAVAPAPQEAAPTPETAAVPAAEPVTIRYTMVADPGELEIRQKAIDDFQQLHSDIMVNAELVPEDGMAQKIVTMVAGGAGPDAVYIHPSFVPLFASQQVLIPLDELGQGDTEFGPDDFFEKVVNHFAHEGKVYGYPYYSGPIVTYFNKKLFDDAGEPYPTQYMEGFQEDKDDWTWTRALEVAQRMTKGEGAERIFGNWPVWMSLHAFNHVIFSFGGEVWNEDMTKCLLTEPAAMEAINYQADLFLRYNVSPRPDQAEGMPEGFQSGRVAMRTGGIRANVPGIVEAGLDAGILPVPSGPAGRVTRDGPNALGILSSSKNTQATWEWVKYMAGPKPGDPGGMKFEFALHRALPTRKSLYDAPDFVNNLLPWEDLEVYRNASQHVRDFPLPTRYAEINSTWNEHWTGIMAEALTVEEGVQAACEEIDRLLTETM
jgi:multiple sugar transport system substrate-binding protein